MWSSIFSFQNPKLWVPPQKTLNSQPYNSSGLTGRSRTSSKVRQCNAGTQISRIQLARQSLQEWYRNIGSMVALDATLGVGSVTSTPLRDITSPCELESQPAPAILAWPHLPKPQTLNSKSPIPINPKPSTLFG